MKVFFFEESYFCLKQLMNVCVWKLRNLFMGLSLLCAGSMHGQMFFVEAKAIPDSVFNSSANTPSMGWNTGINLAAMSAKS